MDDAEIKDPLEGDLGDDGVHEDLEADLEIPKKKDLIDEDVDSLEDLEDEELEEEEEPFDDVNNM